MYSEDHGPGGVRTFEEGIRYGLPPDQPATEAILTVLDDISRENLSASDVTLSDRVDPDALDTLFLSSTTAEVRFTFAGCEVTVYGDRSVMVDRLEPVDAD